MTWTGFATECLLRLAYFALGANAAVDIRARRDRRQSERIAEQVVQQVPNDFGLSRRGDGRVQMLRPVPQVLDAEAALWLAAWIAAVADPRHSQNGGQIK